MINSPSKYKRPTTQNDSDYKNDRKPYQKPALRYLANKNS